MDDSTDERILCLVAMDAAIWEHDFHAGKSIRKIEDVETVFDIRRERSVDPVELRSL